VFRVNINEIKEYDEWFEDLTINDKNAAESIPKEFREEVREYLDDLESFGTPVKNGGARLNLPSSDDDPNTHLINTTFKQVEMEDKTELQAFKESNRGFNQSQQKSGSSERLRLVDGQGADTKLTRTAYDIARQQLDQSLNVEMDIDHIKKKRNMSRFDDEDAFFDKMNQNNDTTTEARNAKGNASSRMPFSDFRH